MKKITFCILLAAIVYTAAIEIIPGPAPVVTTYDESRFYFELKPWPPQCPPCPGYEEITVEFWNKTTDQHSRLCSVEFVFLNGTFDNETNACRDQHDRVELDPRAVVDGVTFVLLDVTYEDTGQYGLVVRYNNSQDTESASTTLTVLVPPNAPKITSSFDETEVINEGQNVNLTCELTNALPPGDLNWTRGLWNPVRPFHYDKASSYDESTVSKIQIHAQWTDHGSSYICWTRSKITNGQGPSSSIALNVTYVPRAHLSPCGDSHVYYVEEGDSKHLHCEVSAFPDPDEILWFRSTIDASHNATQILTGYDNTTEIYLRNLTRESQQFYWCSAINDNGQSDKKKCKLEVQYGPQISIRDMVVVDPGSSVTEECKATAHPPVTEYIWIKSTNRSFVIDDHLLELDDVTVEDAGEYRCVATNYLTPGHGLTAKPHRDMATFNVFVKYSPEWKEYFLMKFGAAIGDSASLVCQVHAYPAVTFTWRYNGNILYTGGNINITTEDYNSTLYIQTVRDTDRGEYQCTATNTKGSDTFFVHLLEPGEPDSPQTCDVHNATDTYVTLSCTPGYDGGYDLSYHIETQDENGQKQPSTIVQQSVKSTNVLLRVTELYKGTTYTVYVYGENSHSRAQEPYRTEVRTTGVGTPSPVGPPKKSLNLGAIIGGSIGGTVGLIAIVLLAMYLYYRHDPDEEEETAEDDKKNKHTPYTVVKQDEYGEDMGRKYEQKRQQIGHQNKAYLMDDLGAKHHQAVDNDYIPHPGLTKDQDDNSSGSSIEAPVTVHTTKSGADPKLRRPDQDPRLKRTAYDQRHQQTNLAGMGAMSHNSHHNLTKIQQLSVPKVEPLREERVETTDSWEVAREKLYFTKKLGDGAFGEVWKVTAEGISKKNTSQLAAVKLAKENCPEAEHQALHKELIVMKMLKPHPNVIGLIGCCTKHDPLLIIMEYAGKGSLQQFLRNNRHDDSRYGQHNMTSQSLTARDLTMFGFQVANGMDYISSKQLLHRDLAARNILVDDNMTCKVSDFGFARDIVNCREYESKAKRRLPIRWMAPESMFDNLYSIKSDVWAFGVVLWEIVTLGSSPYPGMSGSDVMELIQMGYRMDKPKHCSNEMYGLMRACWKQTANHRPDFSDLRANLESLLFDMPGDPSHNIAITQMEENMLEILTNIPGEKC